MLQTPIFEKYDDLVSLAYLGMNESKPWQGFVECLTEAAGLRDASVTISKLNAPDKAMVVTSDHSPHITRDYVHEVLATDVMRIVNDLQIPTASTVNDLLPKRRWLSSDLYQRFLKPFNIQRMLMVDVWRDPVLLVRLTMDRTHDQQEFTGDDRRLLDRLAFHLSKSLDMRSAMQHMHASSQFYQEAMDQLGISTLFLNAAGQLVQSNQTGSELLSGRQGLCLRNGKLAVSEGRSGDQFRQFQRALLTQDSCTPQAVRIMDDNGNTLLEIVGRKLPTQGVLESKTPAAVLLATSSLQAPRDPCPNLMRDLYGFTACEARIAKLLVQGYSTQDAAGVLGVSVNTVKTHLRGIFEKTGYNKQSQVVAALNNTALRLM